MHGRKQNEHQCALIHRFDLQIACKPEFSSSQAVTTATQPTLSEQILHHTTKLIQQPRIRLETSTSLRPPAGGFGDTYVTSGLAVNKRAN